mgnify:CR=1 FL=1
MQKELISYLLNDFEENPTKIWESNIFGKSLSDLVNEGKPYAVFSALLDYLRFVKGKFVHCGQHYPIAGCLHG